MSSVAHLIVSKYCMLLTGSERKNLNLESLEEEIVILSNERHWYLYTHTYIRIEYFSYFDYAKCSGPTNWSGNWSSFYLFKSYNINSYDIITMLKSFTDHKDYSQMSHE